MASIEKLQAAEVAFDTIYHEQCELGSTEEEACEQAARVYKEICGESPDLINQFGFDWFDENTVQEILSGTYTQNHF